MTFTTDRDLLALEPQVFADVPLPGQTRLEVSDGVVTGTTLMSEAADFAAAQAQAGSVVLIAGQPCEVLSRVDAHTLNVSLPRSSPGDAAIAPLAGTSLKVQLRTFSPQAAQAHQQLLSMLGLDPDAPAASPCEDSIISLSVITRLEVLAALQLIYASGAGVSGNHEGLWAKSRHYAALLSKESEQARVLLDLDGDGRADTMRVLGSVTLRRV